VLLREGWRDEQQRLKSLQRQHLVAVNDSNSGSGFGTEAVRRLKG
jgi:hypothetical protein